MMCRWKMWLAGSAVGVGLLSGTMASAQMPQYLPSPTPARLEPERVQPVEAMIESAWLADPLTFQYALKARVTDGGVELRGYVPTQMLKQRALHVAQSVSSSAINDQIQVQPNMEILLPGVAGPGFAEEALSRIKKTNPDVGNSISIHLGVGGVVTLTGHASTLEDKLRIARCLRGMPGCAAVRNNIVIGNNTLSATPVSQPTLAASATVKKPAPIIHMEPTPLVPSKTEPIRLRLEPPSVKVAVQDSQVKPAVAKTEVPVPTAAKPPMPPVKPDSASMETTAKPKQYGTPVIIIFD
jgi:osmotically-inducible protein OsmY